MNSTVIVGVLSLIGTCIGSIGGILASSKLTNYRIEQLEKKVDKHNTVIERVYKLEQNHAVFEEEISVINDQISELKQHHKIGG